MPALGSLDMRIKLWLIIGALLTPLVADAVDLPSMVCREQQVVVISPDTLASHTYESSSLYRFMPKGLYLGDENENYTGVVSPGWGCRRY
jgi:hypothetical protein